MNDSLMDKAVIMARGLGTRMRKGDQSAQMSNEQEAIADTGVKAMIPIDRPFLDYVLHNLSEAGYQKICLVVGPEHDELRRYYQNMECRRFSIEFAIQAEPLGTADAVLAAEDFAGNDPFLVINSDNYYPIEALAGLRKLDGSGLAAFVRESMFAGGNIPAERLTKFAVIRSDSRGFMTSIIEKPDKQTIEQLPEPVCVSMNCWRFNPSIFTACRSISLSPRGEMEITDAVQYSIDSLSERFTSLVIHAPVLDLSSRTDIVSVVEKLTGMEVNL